jgi:hypothetical protein
MEAGQKFNRFTAKELVDLEKILNVLPDTRPKETVTDTYNNGFEKDGPVYQMIMKKIYPKINDVVTENFELSCGFILKANEPYGIHTDYWHAHDKRKNVVGPSVLIPLSVSPNTANITDTHTVIFDQICTDNFQEFKKNNKPIADVNNSAVYLKETILSHCSADDLSYLTVKSVCSWEPGSFLYWDRRLLHSSDSFGTSGIKQKRCIVMFFDEK